MTIVHHILSDAPLHPSHPLESLTRSEPISHLSALYRLDRGEMDGGIYLEGQSDWGSKAREGL